MYNLEGRLDEGNEARDMEYFMALALALEQKMEMARLADTDMKHSEWQAFVILHI